MSLSRPRYRLDIVRAPSQHVNATMRMSCCAPLAVLAACAAAPPDIDALDAVTSATGADSIRWLDTPEPLDAAALPTDALQLGDAVRLALQHDPRLQSALAASGSALAAATQARRWPNPILDVVLRFPSGGGAMQVDAGLGAEVLAILTIGQRAAAADQRAHRACADAVTTALDVVAEVATSYVRLQAFAALAPQQAERTAAAHQLAALARARVANGDGTSIAAAEMEALVLHSELESAATAAEHTREQLRLRRLLGAPGLAAPVGTVAFAEPEPLSTTEARCLAVALRRRPELAAARAEVAALDAGFATAGLGWLAGAQLGAAIQREEADSMGPALALPLPVFDRGADAVRAADGELTAARHRAVACGRGVVEEVRSAWAETAAADQRLRRVRDDLLPHQRARFALADTSWRSGDGDRVDLLRAGQDLRDAESLLVEARRDVWLARVQLQRAVGGAAALAAAQATAEEPLR